MDTHYHIVAIFEAKENGASGVLAQSLGISGRLPEVYGSDMFSEYCFAGLFILIYSYVYLNILVRRPYFKKTATGYMQLHMDPYMNTPTE
jgi:hypothetical protein